MAEKQTLFYDPENNDGQGTHGGNWKMQYTILCILGVVVTISVIFTIPLVICRNHKTNEEELNENIYKECNTSNQNDIIENEKNISTGEIVFVKPRSGEDFRRYEELLGELKSMGCEPRSRLFKVSDLLPKDSKLHDLNYDLQYVALKKCLPECSFCRETSAECLPSAKQIKWIPLVAESAEAEFLTYHLEVTEDQSCECK